MFKQVGVGVGLVCVSLAAGCATGGYKSIEYEAAEMQPVRIEANNEGASVAVDVSRPRTAMAYVKENPWKIVVAAVVTGFAVDKVAENNGWLWHETKSGKSAGGDVIGDESQSAIVLSNVINGDGNTINQNVVIQAPNGSGTGMQGNTGSGGLANAPM